MLVDRPSHSYIWKGFVCSLKGKSLGWMAPVYILTEELVWTESVVIPDSNFQDSRSQLRWPDIWVDETLVPLGLTTIHHRFRPPLRLFTAKIKTLLNLMQSETCFNDDHFLTPKTLRGSTVFTIFSGPIPKTNNVCSVCAILVLWTYYHCHFGPAETFWRNKGLWFWGMSSAYLVEDTLG